MKKQLLQNKKRWLIPFSKVLGVLGISVMGMLGTAEAQTLEPPLLAPVVDVANGPATFTIKINGGLGDCISSTLDITMPSGYEIAPGSFTISSGSFVIETTVSGNTASLSVGNIPMTPGYVEIAYEAVAACNVIGSTMTNVNYSLTTCGGPSTASGIVNARNAKVNIIDVTNGSYTGAMGSTYDRVITLRNDGYGDIDTVYLQSTNGASLSITDVASSSGTLTDMGGGLYRIVGATADGTLNNGEQFTITETVEIISCTGSLTTSWESYIGIDGVACAGTGSTQTGGATIATSIPNIVASTIEIPNMKCLPTGPADGWVTFQAKNTSSVPALFTELGTFHSRSSCHICTPTTGADAAAGGNTCGTRTLYIDTAAGVTYSMDGGSTWSSLDYTVYQSWNAWAAGGGYNDGKPMALRFQSGIPHLDGGDSVRFRFKLHDEIPPCCIADWYQGTISFGGAYTDMCGNNTKSITSATLGLNTNQRYTMNSTSSADAIGGSTYNLTYSGFVIQNNNSFRTDGTGYIDYEITLPTSLDPSTVAADHTMTKGSTILTPDNVTWDATTRKLRLRFLRSTLVSNDYVNWTLSVKTTVDCAGTGSTASLSAFAKLSDCAATEWQVLCNREASFTVHDCFEGCDNGPVNYATKVHRTNYGVYSSTNDGVPSGTMDVSNLRLDYTLNGDTVAVVTNAKMHGTLSYSNIFVTITKSEADALHTFVDATAYIYNTAGITTVTGITAGTTSGTTPSTRIINVSTGIGAPATYAPGDSVVVVTRFRQLISADKRVDFTTTTYSSNSTTFGDVSQIACDGDWTGTVYNMGTGSNAGSNTTLSFTECADITQQYGVSYQINPSAPASTRHARFPYEIRKIFDLDTLRVIVPAGFEITNMKIAVSGQGTAAATGIASYPILEYDASNNIYYYDLSTLPSTFLGAGIPFSEGFGLQITPTIKAICKSSNFAGADNMATFRIKSLSVNAGAYAHSNFVMYLGSTNNSFTPLSMSSAAPHKTVSGDSVSWVIQIANGSSVVKSNTWIAEQNAINSIGIYSVEELTGPSGTVVSAAALASGIYQLGSIPAATTKYFKVNAVYTNCVNDSMVLLTNYGCDAYPANLAVAEATCKVQSLPVSVFTQSAVLQLAITNQPTAPKDLCDVVDYELEVTNAGLGAANTLFVNISGWSNAGMEFVSGSLELQVPGGTYTSMPDANFAAFGPLNRRILIPASALADLGPAQKYRVKFQIKTLACEFISGSRLNFTPQGRNGCDLLISGTTNSSNKINIIGAPEVVPTYTIVSSVDTLIACGTGTASTTYRFKLVNTGSIISGSTDGWRVTMPEGWTLNTSSVSFTHNPTGGAMFTEEEEGNYDFNIGSGLAIGDSVVFTATITSDEDMSALECDAMGAAALIVEQGFVKFNATCIDPVITCELIQLLEPVNESTTINVVKPSYEAVLMIDETATRNSFNVIGSMELSNTSGVYVSQDVTISVYHDLNSNGVYDTGDTLIGAQVEALIDAASQNIAFSIPSGRTELTNYNSLVAVASFECACANAVAYYTNVVLPVGFKDIQANANNCNVMVRFTTASEQNSDRFEIMHSRDEDRNFVKIGEVKSKSVNGHSSNDLDYEFAHLDVQNGMNYYQITQYDFNGRASYSKVFMANVSCQYEEITLHPNPSSDEVYVSGAAEGSDIVVLNNLGQKMQVSIIRSGNLNIFNVSGLADGVYHVVVSKNGKEAGVLKLVVSKK